MAEASDVTCIECGLPAFREELIFWCPGCDKSVVVEVDM